jgi:CubicO group peptidase (beta-lactamase class C family)
LSSCSLIENLKTPKESYEVIEPCDFSHQLPKDIYRKRYDSIGAKQKIDSLNLYFDSAFAQVPFNGCVYIEQKGVVLYHKCMGYDCLNCHQKNILTDTTLFQLASLSKTFTAVAILQLVEQGKLSLDDSVQKFFPNFPYKEIYVKSLLNHRSGLSHYIYSFEDSARKTNAVRPDNQKIMTWFESQKPNVYFMPNRKFSYNNTNYAILAAILEKVTGDSFAHYLEQNILKPLNMNHTFMLNSIPSNYYSTVGHEGTRQIAKDFFDDVLGDKGIYSTINDLIIWYKALNSDCILKRETLSLAFTPQSFEHKGNRNYGLGFRLITEEDQQTVRYIYHNGWWKGYNSLFWFSPKSETFIVMLTNVRNKSIYMMKPLVDILEPSFHNADVTEDSTRQEQDDSEKFQ